MATTTLVPTGDSSVFGWTEEGGGGAPIYDQVDEGIAGADGTGIAYLDIGGSRRTATFLVTNMPGDFNPAGVTAVTCQVKYKQSGRSDDTWTDVGDWSLRVSSGSGTVLAAADSGGTRTGLTTAGSLYETSYTSSNAVGAAYINTGETVANWDNAVLIVGTPLKSSVKGADTVNWYIDAVEVVVTYTLAAAANPPTGNRQVLQLLAH